ncbi:MAG: thioredoxin family protein [Muribaculaceae bacterium]|nr:thioredoxin family protein [Muribaculaceae bacterium]
MKFRKIFSALLFAAALITPSVSTAAQPEAIPDGVQILKKGTTYDVNKAPGHLVVIDFNATWCGPCRRFSPIFEEAAEKYKGQVEFISVDIDQHQPLARNLGITSVPTLLFIRADGKIYSWVGFLPQEDFFKAIDQLKDNKSVTK